MTMNQAIVYVVDDDVSIRTSLGRLLRSAGYAVETFASANEFLEKKITCIIAVWFLTCVCRV
ncbi:MAG: hypothetical protein KCHDKBKB_01310 [Elusimicrobia bacterium]|nr:hypothetical protein [Elusimicrobiota bacterium]